MRRRDFARFARYAGLEGVGDEDFNDIVRLAALVCKMPLAKIGLVGARPSFGIRPSLGSATDVVSSCGGLSASSSSIARTLSSSTDTHEDPEFRRTV